MTFHEIGDGQLPTLVLLHGGGLADWSWRRCAEALQGRFHLVIPVLDGHGENSGQDFVSIEQSADELLAYVETMHGGKVFAMTGLSIGAQILVEALSKNPDITDFAVVESALVYPIPGMTAMTVPTYKLCYGLIKQRWFARMQAKALCVPGDLFETYYGDSLRMSRQSLINMTISNGSYALKTSISRTSARVLVLVGDKEMGVMKKSARTLHAAVRGSELFVAKGMKHGEMSLVHTDAYVARLLTFFAMTASS